MKLEIDIYTAKDWELSQFAHAIKVEQRRRINKGVVITSFSTLRYLADQKQAIWNDAIGKCMPAGFIINMSASIVLGWLDNRRLYTFVKPKKVISNKTKKKQPLLLKSGEPE